jgi:uncharacterized protein YdcH (DUF465 family)
MENFDTVLNELKTWNHHFVQLLFLELLKSNNIKFTNLIEVYNYYLESRIQEMEKDQEISDLTMFAYYFSDVEKYKLNEEQQKHFKKQIKEQLTKRGWKLD